MQMAHKVVVIERKCHSGTLTNRIVLLKTYKLIWPIINWVILSPMDLPLDWLPL